jgi:hypothetical protein
MSAFFALQAKRNVIVEELFKKTDRATDAHETENFAAMKIQATARMRRQRKSYAVIQRAVVDIQRVFRGYCGRKKALWTEITRMEAYNRAVFHHFATVIQARFRAFYSRKHISDYYARKRYLAQVVDASESVRLLAQQEFEKQQALRETSIMQSQRKEYGRATTNLHHLLSTASISGVYRPALAQDGMQTVFGTGIEDDLRDMAQRRKFKPDLPSKSSVVTAAGGQQQDASSSPNKTGGISLSIPSTVGASKKVLRFPHEKTLQNSVSYDFVHGEELLRLAVEKRLADSIHDKPFIAKKPETPKMPRPIAVETPYVGKPAILKR